MNSHWTLIRAIPGFPIRVEMKSINYTSVLEDRYNHVLYQCTLLDTEKGSSGKDSLSVKLQRESLTKPDCRAAFRSVMNLLRCARQWESCYRTILAGKTVKPHDSDFKKVKRNIRQYCSLCISGAGYTLGWGGQGEAGCNWGGNRPKCPKL